MRDMIPNLFSKLPIPKRVPEELERRIADLAQGATPEVFLRRAFDWIVETWGGPRFGLFSKLGRLFVIDLRDIIHTKGYMHCTTMNYLLRVMAVRSGFFKDEDIEQVLTHSWYVAPHQYLRVRLGGGKTITLDPWNYQFGIDYGQNGSGFASLKLTPIR